MIVHAATAQVTLITGQDWTEHVPRHLRIQLNKSDLWKQAPDLENTCTLPEGPIILHLYAGPDTPSALDYTMQTTAPWISPFLVSIDILRDPKRHNMLNDEPYRQILRKAARGEIVALLGAPNCRTTAFVAHQ